MIKYIEAEYIESGTFVTGEEDCFNLNLKEDSDVIIIKKSDFKKIKGFQVLIDGIPVLVKAKYAKYEEDET